MTWGPRVWVIGWPDPDEPGRTKVGLFSDPTPTLRLKIGPIRGSSPSLSGAGYIRVNRKALP